MVFASAERRDEAWCFLSAYEPYPAATDYFRQLLAEGTHVCATEIYQYGVVLKRQVDLASLSVTYEVRLMSGGVLWFFPSTLKAVSDLEYLAAAMKRP